METSLRPLSLGEILDRTAQLYRTHFVLFAGIAAVYAGVMLVLILLQIGLSELFRALHMTQQEQWASLVYVIVIIPIALVFAGAAMAANNRAVAWVNLGQPASIRGAYKSILPRMGRYLWLMTIATFVIYLPLALLWGSYFLFVITSEFRAKFVHVSPSGDLTVAHAGATANPQATMVFGIATLAAVLLTIPAVVYAIIMALRYSLTVPASVVEDLKARKALRRSIDLSKGSRGRIFLLGLLISIIQIGLAALTQVFFVVASFQALKSHGLVPAWLQVTQQVVGFFTNSFIGPMWATGLTLFYYDQRIRKEGYDIEWMMQAAGLTAPAPEPSEPAAPQAELDGEPWPAPTASSSQPPAEEPLPTIEPTPAPFKEPL